MQVFHAVSTALPNDVANSPRSEASSYAPLYVTSSLGDTSFDLEELQQVSINRLKLLKDIEKVRSNLQLGAKRPANVIDSIRTKIRAAERTHGLHVPPKGKDRERMILIDEASHFLVRLALSTKHECRKWLLQTEYDLFATRLDGTGAEFALKAIERANGPVVRPLSRTELEQFGPELDAVARGPNKQRGDTHTSYYQVAFEQVPSLVRSRKVFLRKGQAYLPQSSILDVVAAQFRSILSAGLAKASKYVILADRDERMRNILDCIRQLYLAEENKSFDPSASIETISLNQLQESIPAMPLCMYNMITKLQQNHHLRHAARMQLGVFLKACGLTMDESISFWKSQFARGNISADKFQKQYAYNIRHQYGREGKRRNLPAFNCVKIITDQSAPGEHHGCPYREFEDSRLRSTLRAVGVDPQAIPVIAERAKEKNFQLACGMCFASSQPGQHPFNEYGLPQFIPDHPNAYFIEARKRRFGPAPESLPEETSMAEDDIDDEELLRMSEAVEKQNSSKNSPSKPKSELVKSEQSEIQKLSASQQLESDEDKESGLSKVEGVMEDKENGSSQVEGAMEDKENGSSKVEGAMEDKEEGSFKVEGTMEDKEADGNSHRIENAEGIAAMVIDPPEGKIGDGIKPKLNQPEENIGTSLQPSVEADKCTAMEVDVQVQSPDQAKESSE